MLINMKRGSRRVRFICSIAHLKGALQQLDAHHELSLAWEGILCKLDLWDLKEAGQDLRLKISEPLLHSV